MELPQPVVCCTQLFTDMVLVGKFRVGVNPKIFDLVCPINGCMKEFYLGVINGQVTLSFGK
jgi:hypothetical protein